MAPRILAIVALVITSAATGSAEARYRPIELSDLLKRADLVLVGEIAELADSTYEFRVERSLRTGAESCGAVVDGRITVRRFRDWTCASRWTPYAAGQRLVLCLQRVVDPETGTVSYRPLGAGDEGELPLVDDRVYVHGPANVKMPRGEHSVLGATLHAVEIPLGSIEKLLDRIRPRAADDGAPAEEGDGERGAPPASESADAGS